MSKRYKLLKDLPDCKAGAVFVYNEDYGQYDSKDAFDALWMVKYVENNPEWFELINDRIEVKGINVFQTEGYGKDCRFYTTGDVPKEKLPLIKQAIERVLNGDDEKKIHEIIQPIVDENILLQLKLQQMKEKFSYLNSLTQQNKDQ